MEEHNKLKATNIFCLVLETAMCTRLLIVDPGMVFAAFVHAFFMICSVTYHIYPSVRKNLFFEFIATLISLIAVALLTYTLYFTFIQESDIPPSIWIQVIKYFTGPSALTGITLLRLIYSKENESNQNLVNFNNLEIRPESDMNEIEVKGPVHILMRLLNLVAIAIELFMAILLLANLADFGAIALFHVPFVLWSIFYEVKPSLIKDPAFKVMSEIISLCSLGLFGYCVYGYSQDHSQYGPLVWILVIAYLTGPMALTGLTLLLVFWTEPKNGSELVFERFTQKGTYSYVQATPQMISMLQPKMV